MVGTKITEYCKCFFAYHVTDLWTPKIQSSKIRIVISNSCIVLGKNIQRQRMLVMMLFRSQEEGKTCKKKKKVLAKDEEEEYVEV